MILASLVKQTTTNAQAAKRSSEALANASRLSLRQREGTDCFVILDEIHGQSHRFILDRTTIDGRLTLILTLLCRSAALALVESLWLRTFRPPREQSFP